MLFQIHESISIYKPSKVTFKVSGHTLDMATLDRIYYRQSQPFTCGAACVIMALTYLSKINRPRNEIYELELWRRANSVYMGQGQAGCGPYALAILGMLHDCEAFIYTSHSSNFFDAWNADEKSRNTQRKLEDHDKKRALNLGCRIQKYPKNIKEMNQLFLKRYLPMICLCGGYDIDEGHWVFVLNDEKDYYILDPYCNENSKNIYKLSAEEFYKSFHYLDQRISIVFTSSNKSIIDNNHIN